MRHDGQAFELRLGDEHAIKGIPVVAWEIASGQAVGDRNGQRLEAVPTQLGLQVQPC
jgi:hypothetical protein